MKRLLLVMVVLGANVAGGCAGSKKAVREPANPELVGGETESQSTGAGVTMEQNDAIDAVFRRKAQQLNSCWHEEYEKTKNRKLEGDISVGLTVTPSGKPADVRILKSTMGNPNVESCVTREVGGWTFPEVPSNTPYNRTVHLGPEF